MARAFSVGESEVISVSDGNLVLPGSMFFDGLPQAELMPILEAAEVAPEQVTPPCNLTLLRQGDRLVLFDAGSGPAFMPSAGSILDSLDQLGIAAEDITDVIFTHAHPDHLWGVLDDFDEPVFYEARHLISEAEWAYWTDPATVNSIGEARASFAVGAARRLDTIAEQMAFFKDGEEVLPGVMSLATHGHTPGHTSFEIRDGSAAVMVGGDAIGNHHVALARPEWLSGSDQDPETGAATRLRLLDRIVTDDIALLGFHLPQGGLGRLERRGEGYHFTPEDAS
ncbi:MAG: MBL fold metallo-hydrolase [Roseobacter sp.]|jgi:glyoxylase-like metal-dependent hydrolase (beta-lactamase superfamily II)|nr:MBL fold metallo-hydrolase [Roseobacter sp.]